MMEVVGGDVTLFHHLTDTTQGTMEAIHERLRPSKEDPIIFFMEANDLVEADATRLFYHLTQRRGWTDLFPSIFPVPKGPQPLQAADMVVYEGARYSSEIVLGFAGRKARGLWRAMHESQRFIFSTMRRAQLASHAAALLIESARDAVNPDPARHESFRTAEKRMQQESDPNYKRPR
jgi:hypothetical protein